MFAPPGKLAVLVLKINSSAIEDLSCPSLLCLPVLELESSLHANEGGHQASCGKSVAGVIIKERSFADELGVS